MELVDSISFQMPMFCVRMKENLSDKSFLYSSSMSNKPPNCLCCYELSHFKQNEEQQVSIDDSNIIQTSQLISPSSNMLTQPKFSISQPKFSSHFTKQNIYYEETKFPITDIEILDQLSLSKNSTYFCTTSDKLNLYSFTQTETPSKYVIEHLDSLLLNRINCPLTSVSSHNTELLVSSTDCTICLIDLSTFCVKTRLLAHDQPIYCCQWSGESSTLFYTCSFDGSLREFDSRNVSSFNVLYQSSKPILRCRVCPQNANLIGLFCLNSNNYLD